MVKILLTKSPQEIKDILYPVVYDRMSQSEYYKSNPNKFTEKYFNTFFNKHLFVLSYVLTHNYIYDREPNAYCTIDSKGLSDAYGKHKWQFMTYDENKKKMVIPSSYSLVKEDLINAGILRFNEYYSKKKKVAKKVRVIQKINDYNDLKWYTISGGFGLSSIHNYNKKVRVSDLSNPLILHNYNFVSSLDFGSVDVSNLSNFQLGIINGFKNVNVFQKTDRIYSNFTSLRKDIRQQLEIDGTQIGCIDIKNSQIVFLKELLKKDLKLMTSTFSTLQLFDAIDNGKFYELVSGNERLEGKERDLFKKEVLKFLYQKGRTKNGFEGYETLVGNIFKERFPQVYNLIIKYEGVELSNVLRLEESKIVHQAYQRIIDLNINAGTLFDAIYSKETDLNTIYEVMTQVFKENGITATLKIEKYNNVVEQQETPLPTPIPTNVQPQDKYDTHFMNEYNKLVNELTNSYDSNNELGMKYSMLSYYNNKFQKLDEKYSSMYGKYYKGYFKVNLTPVINQINQQLN